MIRATKDVFCIRQRIKVEQVEISNWPAEHALNPAVGLRMSAPAMNGSYEKDTDSALSSTRGDLFITARIVVALA